MSSRRFIGILLLAVITACGQDSTRLATAPTGPLSLGVGRDRVPNVQASGFVEVNNYGYFDTYSFEARSRRGVATGTFRWMSDQPNGEISRGSGRVLCLTVIGNVAHLGGELQPDDLWWAPPPFNHVIWTVADNDKMAGEAPDYASLVIAFKTREQVAAHCAVGNLVMRPIDRGDVKVRGGVRVGVSEDADDEDDEDDEGP